MAKDTLYLKAEQKVEIGSDTVTLSDVAKMTCTDAQAVNRLKTMKVHKFHEGDENRKIISILKIIEMIHETYPEMTVESLGETDIVVERIKARDRIGIPEILKIVFVCLVSFFGTGFTIMAFHNDIGITEVFSGIYELIMGTKAEGFTILELSYSIGLTVGIIVFFNHIGGRKITKDPTPIEVEMRTYETDVNTALIETSNREGKSLDVD